ncbi:MAG: hypothetical protein E3J72_06650 [Planctomycetota bacterium]|nr:MAG: hypothetical protein E3J72_06650 [Planctomycetota bacterium]
MRKLAITITLVLLLATPVVLYGEDNPDKLPWRSDVKAAFDEADENGKPVVIGFLTPWGSSD